MWRRRMKTAGLLVLCVSAVPCSVGSADDALQRLAKTVTQAAILAQDLGVSTVITCVQPTNKLSSELQALQLSLEL